MPCLRSSALLGALALLGACSDSSPRVPQGPAPPPLWESGARLRARTRDGGEGARQFVAWHDAELDVDCAFAAAEDGATRCLPLGTEYPNGFADAGCTVPLVLRYPDACGLPTSGYVSVPILAEPATCPADTLPPRTAVRSLEPAATPQTFYQGGPGECFETVPGDVTVFGLGPAIDPARFVAADVADVPQGDALVVRRRIAEDGSTQTIQVRDRARDAECLDWLAYYGSDYEDRCVAGTFTLSSSGLFLENHCTTPAEASYVDLPPGCDPPDHFLVFDYEPTCGAVGFAVRSIGAESQVTVYQDGGECLPVPPSGPDTKLLGHGEVIAPETFAPLARASVGTGRLTVKAWVDDAGRPILTTGYTFDDSEHGRECQVTRLGSTLRCVTDYAYFYGQFADPGCTEPIVGVHRPDADAACAVPPIASVMVPEDTCGTAMTMHALGATLPTPEMIYVRIGSGAEASCLPQPPDTASPGYTITYLRVADALDPGSYPEVVEVVE
jgi:hypothetical protein